MHKVSTIGSLRGFAAAWVLGFGAVAFTLPACSSDDAATEARAAGSIDLALTGVSGSGQTYRLRQGEIAITGTSTAAVSTEDHLDESRVSLELPAGGYLAALAEGWHLERLGADGTWSEIRAVLTSVNPLPFTVVDQGVTDVTLTFRAGDEVVELGNGRIPRHRRRRRRGAASARGHLRGGLRGPGGDGLRLPGLLRADLRGAADTRDPGVRSLRRELRGVRGWRAR